MRYRSPDEDSARWDGFPFREGDIVISTRSKSGTTWAQMICALLIFQDPDLPAPLSELSPWLDWLVLPRDEVYARLEAQRHRRFIKTHTPLDGIPLDPRATYVVVARHPLDMAVSLFHQGDNLDRARIAELLGQPAPAASTAPPRSLRDALIAWINRDVPPADALDSLPGVMWHLTDAWHRTNGAATGARAATGGHGAEAGTGGHGNGAAGVGAGTGTGTGAGTGSPGNDTGTGAEMETGGHGNGAGNGNGNGGLTRGVLSDNVLGDDNNGGGGGRIGVPDVVLVHYADLMNDLEGEMRRLANRLGIEVPEERWPLLVEAAGFAQMRARADRLAPDPVGIMKDRTAFFRRGGSGGGRELLTDEEFAHYEQRAAELAPRDLLAWLHR
ncbi:sulfotransferase domain-containing protein [Couchioplanes azureus]|uniref:sulfotransferase domain-containing protein n=1 Tax=Couchioplanes caeruleus TaxID=56438 RepID=UPI0019BFF8DF|nr:sulfotransferase domain-containing protein [Couchioplanes caeruleus]GGQ45913.1 hypothetical protein GCM10010166_13160 [Couchioplanes caeruleus subsp. azureus]